jgi:hypothetical protein
MKKLIERTYARALAILIAEALTIVRLLKANVQAWPIRSSISSVIPAISHSFP